MLQFWKISTNALPRCAAAARSTTSDSPSKQFFGNSEQVSAESALNLAVPS